MGKGKNAMNNTSARKRAVGLRTLPARTAGAQPSFPEPPAAPERRALWREEQGPSGHPLTAAGAWVCATENVRAPQPCSMTMLLNDENVIVVQSLCSSVYCFLK